MHACMLASARAACCNGNRKVAEGSGEDESPHASVLGWQRVESTAGCTHGSLDPEGSTGLQDAPNVTDAGVLSFIMMCGNLQCLTLAGNLRLRGGFLPVLLTRCTKLTSLTITGAPDFYLGSAQHPLMDIAPNPSIRHLALEGMGTDSDLVGLCQKLPSLHTLAVDGPPNALQTVVCQWCARCLHAKAPHHVKHRASSHAH